MKRVLILLCTLAVSVTVWGQGKINTRKYILSDFNDKVIQVVLTGNDLIDSGLRQEVVNIWTASPFEFCTMDRFEAMMAPAMVTSPQITVAFLRLILWQ